jgi:hypothetical protein
MSDLELLKNNELIEIVENQSKKLVTATSILEMVLLSASDLTDEISKQNLTDADYKRIKRHIKNGYKFIRKHLNR